MTQFACVFDHDRQDVVWVSAGAKFLLGELPAADAFGWTWFADRLHPADAPAVIAALAMLREHLCGRCPPPGFQFSLDYRLRHARGHFCRVLHQVMPLGTGPLSLLLFTDLTHHKLTHEVRVHANWVQSLPTPGTPALRPRQREVLALVVAGYTSRQIAHQLGLRESTVKAHRRNLHRKIPSRNIHALLAYLQPADRLSPDRESA